MIQYRHESYPILGRMMRALASPIWERDWSGPDVHYANEIGTLPARPRGAARIEQWLREILHFAFVDGA